ncbi:hypothetical protein HK103_004374, partial [Boothiomyces macroporosus]
MEKEIDEKLQQFLNNLSLAIQSLTSRKNDVLKTKVQLEHDTLLIKRAASNMTLQVESLLETTSLLKQSILLNDLSKLNKQIKSRKVGLQEQRENNITELKNYLNELSELEDEINSAL